MIRMIDFRYYNKCYSVKIRKRKSLESKRNAPSHFETLTFFDFFLNLTITIVRAYDHFERQVFERTLQIFAISISAHTWF